MSANTIFETHRKFLLLNTFLGFTVLKTPYYSYTVQLFLKFTNLLTIFILFFSSVIIVGGLSDPDGTMEQACSSAILCFTLIITTFSGFYLYYKSDELNSIILLMNDLIIIFMNNPFGISHFRVKLNSQYKLIMAFSVTNTICTYVTAVIYVVPMYLQSFKSLGFSGEMDLPFKLLSPVNYYVSPVYDFAFFIEIFAIVVASVKKLLSEVLIIAMIHVSSLFLQHLKYSFNVVFSDIDDINYDTNNNSENYNVKQSHTLQPIEVKHFFEEEIRFQEKSAGSVNIINYQLEDEERKKKIAAVEKKLKQWAILHQKVLKLCSEMNKFFDPILTVYMCCITAAITLAAFTFTMGFAQTLAQITSAVFYYFSCMVTLYLLCHMGHSVTYESLTVADEALYTKWYNTNKKIANSLKIIFQRVKTPVLMTAFRSPNFDLSKETFLVFAKSTVSFYLALIELKKSQAMKNK